jgi:hypothetical protein
MVNSIGKGIYMLSRQTRSGAAERLFAVLVSNSIRRWTCHNYHTVKGRIRKAQQNQHGNPTFCSRIMWWSWPVHVGGSRGV